MEVAFKPFLPQYARSAAHTLQYNFEISDTSTEVFTWKHAISQIRRHGAYSP